jgi:hypothetical protein
MLLVGQETANLLSFAFLAPANQSFLLVRSHDGLFVDSGVMPYSWILCLPRTILDWKCGRAFIPALRIDG